MIGTAWERYFTERGITRLVHFTPCSNLAGILAQGLLPANELGSTCVRNDSDRYEGDRFSCLSVEFPNTLLFWKFRFKAAAERGADLWDDWVVLSLAPSVAARSGCEFTIQNASKNSEQFRAGDERKGLPAFKLLFGDVEDDYGLVRRADHERDYRLSPAMTTHIQSEVLHDGPIPLSCIRRISFNSTEARKKWLRGFPDGIEVWREPSMFKQRGDQQFWKNRK